MFVKFRSRGLIHLEPYCTGNNEAWNKFDICYNYIYTQPNTESHDSVIQNPSDIIDD